MEALDYLVFAGFFLQPGRGSRKNDPLSVCSPNEFLHYLSIHLCSGCIGGQHLEV